MNNKFEQQEQEERRRWPRSVLTEPDIGLLCASGVKGSDVFGAEPSCWPHFFGVYDHAHGGVLVESDRPLPDTESFRLLLHDFTRHAWCWRSAELVWQRSGNDNGNILSGLHFLAAGEWWTSKDNCAVTEIPATLFADIESLFDSEMLDAVPRHAFWPLLNALRPIRMAGGQKILTQGGDGDSLFLIRDGSCLVVVEQDGVRRQVARLGKGDVIGELAVLTGEKRAADVVAETEVQLWRLGGDQFERIACAFPDLRFFLTELLTHRLEHSASLADRTIGRYVVKRKLGQGAWGIVYQGTHAGLGMPVAVKMLKHRIALDPDFSSKFLDEARIIAELRHRNIIQVFDIEKRFKTLFIVMEFLEGESLKEALTRMGRIPPAETADILMQACDGLAYAHDKGIVHQDIKPENLWLRQDGTLKILDFGLACTAGSGDMTMHGTIQYSAPEQFDGHRVDARTDMYCLAITAYELLTGRRPFPEDDLMQLINIRLVEDIPDPGLVLPDLPATLRRFVVRAGRRDPGARYQSMVEAMADLRSTDGKERQKDRQAARRRMLSMVFFYDEEKQVELRRLLEDCGCRCNALGVSLRGADFRDL